MIKNDLIQSTQTDQSKGIISWMVHNRITPNILMLVFIVGGLFISTKIKQEVFPEFDLDYVNIGVSYPGSSPEEVEQGIVLAVEEGIRGLDGVKEISSSASEGYASIYAELYEDADSQKVYQDIKQELDRITTFPEDAEEPNVSLLIRRRSVLKLQIYGDENEWVLREVAEQVRDQLLQNPGITQIDLLGARNYEIQIEVDQDTLRTYDLTLENIASKIRKTSVEIPGGTVETRAGDILLRVKQRRDWAKEFETIPVVTTAEGTILYLSDIATVNDNFEETDFQATFNGQRTIGLAVYRIGKQTPIGVSAAVKEEMGNIEKYLPANIKWSIKSDFSRIYKQRLELLLKNAFYGLLLVLALLGIFLEFKLAFWVTMGIPTSFLGTILFLPAMDATINMVSMFAFIIALGIVVDDAIVAGENIYEYRKRGMGIVKSAILGARDVAIPVSFSILTNIIAFLPLYFVPGVMGKFFRVIPLVVITVFTISWIESLLVLPSHLAHFKPSNRKGLGAFLHERQQKFSELFTRFVENYYGPFLDKSIKYRYITIALGIAVFAIVIGYVKSGRIGIILMTKVESDQSVVTAALPYGSPFDKTLEVYKQIIRASEEIIVQNGGDELSEGTFAVINENSVEVTVYLTDPEIRPISTSEFTKKWRQAVGEIPGLESSNFQSDKGGPGSGASLTVELSHRDINVLDQACVALAEKIAEFPNTTDINDGYTPGKRQFDFQIKPEGESLGLTAYEVARQVRNSFYGAEALRQQRGRNEVKVKVMLPKEQRNSEYHLEELLIRTPSGTDVPLMQIAYVVPSRSYTSIERRNARRIATVSSNIEPASETNRVIATLNKEIIPELLNNYPGLSVSYQGKQADFKESFESLITGFILAMLGIFVMLAIPFKSYTQPLIVMVAVPFGIVGAVLGHIIMGYSLSIMSMMGIIALSGVVVNDSLVLIDCSNKLKIDGMNAFEAIHNAGIRRFRPIILTSLTTFGGLMPMIFETSMQAKFMIPMAISLGYGILFATGITLILVPSLNMSLEDFKSFWERLKKNLQ